MSHFFALCLLIALLNLPQIATLGLTDQPSPSPALELAKRGSGRRELAKRYLA